MITRWNVSYTVMRNHYPVLNSLTLSKAISIETMVANIMLTKITYFLKILSTSNLIESKAILAPITITYQTQTLSRVLQ